MKVNILDNVIKYWFQNINETDMNAFWFDQTSDQYITENFKEIVDSININNYKSYITDNNSMISLLIVGDQFTRNIYRNDNIMRTKNDCWALELAQHMIDNNIDLMVPLNHRYFILLPLRHNKTSKLLDIVCMRIKLYLSEYSSNIPSSLVKFYTNTIQNYTYLTDSIKIGGNIMYNEKFKEILETYDLNNNNNNSIPLDIISGKMKDKLYNNIGLSLSGGVDSMVLLNCLSTCMKSFGNKVVAIHIEHCNRDVAKLEREFLEYYCNLLGVKLYYRTIDYINRSNDFIDRNIIEEETKKARFNLYKYVVEKENLNGVILGHHMGDIVENVFTNIIKGRNLNNLTVMKEMDTMYNVNIFRPYLNISKDVIFDYAHYNVIPYFLNSTPAWSCRGVLRDMVIPTLKKQFGAFEHNIIKFTQDLSEVSSFYEKEMNRYIDMMVVDTYMCKIVFDKEYILKENVIDMILLKIMHSNGYHMVKKKARKHFIEWLSGNKDTQIDLDKNLFSFYNKKNNYLYFVNYTKIAKEISIINNINMIFDNMIPQKIKNLI
jgi:tRNA(Ile)-lysidine synthetase-like protein